MGGDGVGWGNGSGGIIYVEVQDEQRVRDRRFDWGRDWIDRNS